MIRRGNQRVANLAQIGDGLLVRRADAGRQLDHAFGNFRHDVAGNFFVLDEAQQIRAGFGQIIVVRVDDLHSSSTPKVNGFESMKGSSDIASPVSVGREVVACRPFLNRITRVSRIRRMKHRAAPSAYASRRSATIARLR